MQRSKSFRRLRLSVWPRLACVHAQELLDYLKQFDKDGKGALSKEELQEVMRGRMTCVWDFTILGPRIPGRTSHRKRDQHR